MIQSAQDRQVVVDETVELAVLGRPIGLAFGAESGDQFLHFGNCCSFKNCWCLAQLDQGF